MRRRRCCRRCRHHCHHPLTITDQSIHRPPTCRRRHHRGQHLHFPHHRPHDYGVKVILLGDSAVGKSKLVERYMMGNYNPRQVSGATILLISLPLFLFFLSFSLPLILHPPPHKHNTHTYIHVRTRTCHHCLRVPALYVCSEYLPKGGRGRWQARQSRYVSLSPFPPLSP